MNAAITVAAAMCIAVIGHGRANPSSHTTTTSESKKSVPFKMDSKTKGKM